MKVLVTGSRNWTDKGIIHKALKNATTIIQGGARGADKLAHDFGIENMREVITYAADWKQFGKGAGYIRNRLMLDKEKPDEVMAFWDGESHGTHNMIEYAIHKNYKVTIYYPNGSKDAFIPSTHPL